MTPEHFQQAEVERRQQAVDIAVLQQQMRTVNEQMARMSKALDDITAKLEEVNITLTEARGGWRTLMWLGGAAAGAGSLFTWILTHVNWGPK